MRRLAVLAMCTCAGALAAPRGTVELLPQASVAADTVLLGEVAHVNSPDLDVVRKLANLPIGRAPGVGEPALVQRDALVRWVRTRTGLSESELEWRGAAASRVLRTARVVRGEEIAAAAIEALRGLGIGGGAGGELRVRQVPRDIEAPAGDISLRVRVPVDPSAWRGRTLAWVEVWSGKVFLRSVAVPLEAAAGFIADGAPLAPATPSAPLPRAPADAGAVLVARGDWATLRSSEGVVTLESRVEVLQDGRAGQRVRVRPVGATGIVFARVLGPAQLELAP